MPSPRKRALRAAVGNILVPQDATAPTTAQLAYSNAWWTTVLTEHANNYASSDKPFANGESVLITGTGQDYDGLISGGEPGTGAAMRAAATITFTGTFPWMGSGAGGAIVLRDTAGTTMTLTLNNGTNTSSNGVIGGDSVPGGNAAGFARRFAEAVNATTGNIKASPTDGSNATITLTQTAAGTAGNTSVTNPVGNTKVTATNFLGGAAPLSAAVPHYWFDATNAQANVAAAEAVALVTADGVLYDPSGPLSQYIPIMETVSAGDAKFVCIKPTGWGTNDYITWELIGDTEASNDKLTMRAVGSGDAVSFLKGIKTDGSAEDVDAKAGTVEYTGRVTYDASVNAKGIYLVFEADGTGADDSSMKKGWYLRWKYTAV